MRGELIDFLRPATVVGQAGAQQISIPPGGIYWPSETGRTTFSRRKPGSQTAITASQPTTGSLKMTPKEMAGLVKIPNPLLRWSMPAAESLVRRALAMDSELACDLDRLEGEGGTDSILGIIRQPMSVAETPTADKVTLHVAKTTGNDGNTFEPEDPGTMLGLVEDAPDINGATAFLMRGGMFWALSNRRADAGQTGDAKGPFMFPFTRGQMGQAVQKDLLGKPVLTSPQIVRTRRKGNSTNLTYVLTGNFNRVVIGRLGALEIAVSTERAFELNETWIRAVSYDDMVITHPQSLVFCNTLVQA
jgi:HK97 family phage major capsid protein